MSKKSINYNSLKIDMELQVKCGFIENGIIYKKGDKVTIVELDPICHNVTVLKEVVSEEDKITKCTMKEINTWFKIVKSKNILLDKATFHNDVRLAIRNDKTIIVMLDTEFKGVATCDDESVFSEDIGYTLAYFKAKKKEANYRYRADKNEYKATIRAAQMQLENIEKNYIKTEKKYNHYIKNVISQVQDMSSPAIPF